MKNPLGYKKLLARLTKSNSDGEERRIYAKDIIIPLVSAFAAVGLNQFFFVSNKITESMLEIRKESIQTQRPVLNRILAFTYKYDVTTLTTVQAHTRHYIYVDQNGNKVKEEDVEQKPNYIDTTVPSFVLDTIKRKRLFEDIDAIIKQRDLLDHDIYIAFDRVLTFLSENAFPINKDALFKSKWADSTVVKKWDYLIDNLRNSSCDRLTAFE